MSKDFEFTMVGASDSQVFAAEVEEYLNTGWVATGEIMVREGTFYLAMYKDNRPPQPHPLMQVFRPHVVGDPDDSGERH